ncbi:MAG: dTDP-4-dehydrorhamnose 3,5-epimerase [Candidatus Marinimicrobia bacterium]|jgi:dTDP-4-dehydrorhamnose 3,5-epimerase|nr:dTDP-4-dehydrorhamnose 3,5-epimerase [Candidatus Neomarinimicrobiota bacterium]
MKVIETSLKDVLILEPKVFGDERGFFFESWNQNTFKEVAGVNERFVQDNHSKSQKGVLRGLHYQLEQSQGKLVRTVTGVVLDVVVDLRKSSATFGEHITVELSAESHHQLWIPAGFAHGFVVLSESADFLYKTTNYYAPQHEQCIRWDDPDLGIDWKLKDFSLSLSEKDKQGNSFREATYF